MKVISSAPRLDLLRKQAAFKIADKIGNGTITANKVNGMGLAGDNVFDRRFGGGSSMPLSRQ